MKRILTIVAFIGFVACAFAQSTSLVTLSHEGQLRFFEGYSALENALDSAQNGDVLYLSRGIYAVNTPDLIINKKVRLVGDGYDTFISSRIQFICDGDAWTYSDAEPALEGLRISHVNNTEVDSGFTDMMVIRACKIDELGFRTNSEAYVLDRCYIGKINNKLGDGEPSMYAKNCKIGYFDNNFLGGKVVFENCNIKNLYTFAGKAFSCIVEEITLCGGEGYLYKCLLGAEYNDFLSDSRVDECNIANLSQVENLNYPSYDYLGSDGTPVGIMGGQTPYSEAPSVPTVNMANSRVDYDSNSNQLNVTITVKE